MSICCSLFITMKCMSSIYRVSRGECARLRENVPYIKVHQSNPKHLYPKLNCYGDNGERKVWSSYGSTYCTRFACCYPTMRVSVLQSHSRVKHIPPSLSTDVTVTVNCNWILLDIRVPCKSAWNPKDNYDISASLCSLIDRLYVTHILLRC